MKKNNALRFVLSEVTEGVGTGSEAAGLLSNGSGNDSDSVAVEYTLAQAVSRRLPISANDTMDDSSCLQNNSRRMRSLLSQCSHHGQYEWIPAYRTSINPKYKSLSKHHDTNNKSSANHNRNVSNPDYGIRSNNNLQQLIHPLIILNCPKQQQEHIYHQWQNIHQPQLIHFQWQQER
jgi:hypothetical protein